MRLQFSLRTLLLLVTLASVVLACWAYFYPIWELESRRQHTLDRLSWSGGTDADREIRDKLMKAVASSTSSSLQSPRLVLATTAEHPDLGYILIVDWLSHAPMVDGVQITFQDGATSNVEFVEEILAEIEFNSKDMVLFTGAVYRDEFPPPANRTNVNDVAFVALLSGDTVSSNRVAVEYRQPP